MYPNLYRAIADMTAREAKRLPVARKIVRRSGFRPGTTDTSSSGAGSLLLSAPACQPSTGAEGLDVGSHWYPVGLPHFVTLWDLTDFTEAIVTVPVLDATPTDVDSVYTLSAVWALTYADMIAADYETLTSVTFDGAGFSAGGWQAIDEDARAEVYIAFVLTVQEAYREHLELPMQL